MKTTLKKTAIAALVAGIFFITSGANAATVHGSILPDTGKMGKMTTSKMNSKMSKKKKMDKMDKMGDSKMKPASDAGKM